MNNQNLSQENIELESQKIELQVSEIDSENKPEYAIGIITPPLPENNASLEGSSDFDIINNSEKIEFKTDIFNEVKQEDLIRNNLTSLEPIKSDIQHLIEIIQGKMNSTNNDRVSVAENTSTTNTELQQTIAAIKAELSKIDNLEASGLYEQLEQVEKLSQTAQEFNGQLSSAVENKIKAARQVALAIAKQMAQAEDAEDLFRIVAAQLQKVLQADRVVLYQFDSVNSGTVLMESMVTGWTPMLLPSRYKIT